MNLNKGIEMNITLNIGLDVSKNYLSAGVAEMRLHYKFVEDFLKRELGTPVWIGLAQSATEKTVVVQYTNVEEVLPRLFWLAHELKQDCIAYRVQDDASAIIGGAYFIAAIPQ